MSSVRKSSRYFKAGCEAGEPFQALFDRTGGRERKLPKPPYNDVEKDALWQAGFDFTTEAARLEMTCADCGGVARKL